MVEVAGVGTNLCSGLAGMPWPPQLRWGCMGLAVAPVSEVGAQLRQRWLRWGTQPLQPRGQAHFEEAVPVRNYFFNQIC